MLSFQATLSFVEVAILPGGGVGTFPWFEGALFFGQQGWKGVMMLTLDYGDLLICVITCWPRWCSQQLQRDPSLATRTCTVIESIQEEGQLDLS